ncbi:ATP-binding protein [Frankia sp. Cpl3]|nr:ATP-binding protein [Frankia sp. Cpl3]
MDGADLLPDLVGTERGLVVMMCGLSGSGKSTCARALERRGYARLSIDELVWEWIGRDAAELDPAEYEHLRSTAERQLWGDLIRLMKAKVPVVIDYSFWNRSTRDRYKAVIESHGCRWLLVFLPAELETLRRRLAIRNRRDDANSVTVSDDLLERYFAHFQQPVGEGERVIFQSSAPADRR